MNDKVEKALHILLAMAIASAVTFWADRRHDKGPETIIETVTDTLIVRDTVTVSKPVPYNVYVVDTMWFEVPVYGGRDTVFVPLPREVKEYKDSNYRAVVSGFRPSLDTISVYPKTVVITTTERIQPPRWSWGVQAGLGASKDGITPYVGVGIQYRLQFRKK